MIITLFRHVIHHLYLLLKGKSVQVHHGGQHSLEVPKTILFLISLKKIGINDVSHDIKNIDQLLDVLYLDLIVDVHHGDQQVPEVPKTIFIRFPFKKIVINDVSHEKKILINFLMSSI